MRTIDRHICREILSHALLGLAVFTFVFFVPQLVRLLELVAQRAGSASSILLLIATLFPGVLTFTIPIAVLVGVLIGLGRMSADSELIALNALGIGLRRLLIPVGLFAMFAAALTSAMTLWLGPAAVRTFRALEQEMRSSQASFQVQPRVFDERFPGLVLYVEDISAAATRWRGVFLTESGTEPGARLTLAEDAIVIADRAQGKLQFHLNRGSTHEYSRSDPSRYQVTTFGESDWPIEVGENSQEREAKVTPQERSLASLAAERGAGWRDARTELYRRLSFPGACLVFAVLAVPLGARPRRTGRAAGLLITLLLICAYYVLFIAGVGFARQGNLPPAAGVWGANALMGLLGLALLPSMDQIRSSTWLSDTLQRAAAWLGQRRVAAESRPKSANGAATNGSLRGLARWRHGAGFPQLMDLYVLKRFAYYFGLGLVTFVLLYLTFTFFELLDDIARNHISSFVVLDYFRYLTPYLVYQFAPLAGLVGGLVTLGVLSKNNEVVAFKASGVSLYRLVLPLLLAGIVLAGGMFLMDETFLPAANRKQDSLHNQIKGRPAQTFFQTRQRWIFGSQTKIYNYDVFDPDQQLFGGLSVFELDPRTFQMKRRIYAARAEWDERQHGWLLENGWIRDFDGAVITHYTPFGFTTLPELSEPPSYFHREVRQYDQMTWNELRQYIGSLRQAGFDSARLTVQWHKKLAYPLVTPLVLLMAMPFAFLVGTRGAVGGVAMGVVIAMAYITLYKLFETFGGVGQLPPGLAGWAPDIIFGFFGIYFFLRMPT